jgi:1-acyl-sn-glycerol-3-phosphate acyltransferase
MASEIKLLGQKRFGPFFLTQFLGAFNDNVFKNALMVLIGYKMVTLTQAEIIEKTNIANALFILPFFLFSAISGQIADKYEKSMLIRNIKVLEIAIMVGAAIGFYFNQINILLAVLFMMGTQSALFGPVKYSILPQFLKEEELVGGNGLVEMGTFVAILLGSLLGGLILKYDNGDQIVSFVIIGLAIMGYLSSRSIPIAAASDTQLKINWNIATETWSLMRYAKSNHTVFLSVLGISWFWFFGAVMLTQLPTYTKVILGSDEEVFTLLLATFSIGVGVGSMMCEFMSRKRVEIGLVPFGSIGMTWFVIDLFFAQPVLTQTTLMTASEFISQPNSWRILIDVVLVGAFAGFYIVPLYALIQTRTEASHRSRVIAANNILNALFMVVAAAFSIGILSQGFSIAELFLALGILNAIVAIFIYTQVPEFLLRFVCWILMNVMYRLKTKGTEHIPATGSAVIVCNHVSYVDALIILAASPRPIRFVMDHRIFKVPVLSYLFRTMRAIPIAPAKEDPTCKDRAFKEVAKALEAGELVGIFPEGRLTPDGELSEFRAGIEEIVKTTPVPVIPIALKGLWGSLFSRHGGKAITKVPKRFWSRVELIGSDAVPAESVDKQRLQQTVEGLLRD